LTQDDNNQPVPKKKGEEDVPLKAREQTGKKKNGKPSRKNYVDREQKKKKKERQKPDSQTPGKKTQKKVRIEEQKSHPPKEEE